MSKNARQAKLALMKTVGRNLLLLLFSCSQWVAFGQNKPPADQKSDGRLKVAYTIPENDLIPEGIAYDPVEKAFYVSSTYKRKILKINSRGVASNFTGEMQDGLYGVLGMRVDAARRILWAVCIDVGKAMPLKHMDSSEYNCTGLFKYDLTTGKLLHKYLFGPAEGASFNDLALDKNGKPYITATRGGKVYTLNTTADTLEVFKVLPAEHFPNGIDFSSDYKYLFVAMYADPMPVVGRIDMSTGEMIIIKLPENGKAGADGLYYYNHSLVAVLPEPGNSQIIAYQLDAELKNISASKVLLKHDKLLSQPSTGVVVGGRLYFVATSNLKLFARLYNQNNGKVDLKDLPPVRIGVIELN
jgi:DNA-binding beta-propeller fold protein YncE